MTDENHRQYERDAAADAPFDRDAVIAYLQATRRHWSRVHAIRGVTCIHAWLSQHAGQTWQERWVAADGDANVETVFGQWQAQHSEPDTPAWGTFAPRHSRHGLGTLVELGLLRPGPGYMLRRNSKIAHKQVLARNLEEIERIISVSARVASVSADTAWSAKYALAAMIATTGKPLREIGVEDWLNAERTRSDLLKPYREWTKVEKTRRADGHHMRRPPRGMVTDNTIFTLHWAYAAAVRAGAITPDPHPPAGMTSIPVTLNVAKSKPRTIEAIIETHEDVLRGRIYDFVLRVLNEWYSGHDYQTRRQVVGNVALFLRAIQAVHPGHESLRVPRASAAPVVEFLTTRTDRFDPDIQKERMSLPSVLSTVRRFYELAQMTVEDDPDFADLIGPFPIPRQTVSMLSAKYSKQRRSRLHAQIRDRITSLDDIVPAAEWLASEAQQLLRRAEAAPPGGTFAHGNSDYLRHDTATHPDSPSQLLTITIEGGKRPSDVRAFTHRAVRTRALVTTLRHTGVRIEEAVEIAQDDLGFAQIDGANVPCLTVGPAKTDTVRTIALHRDAIEALVDLVRSHNRLFGEVPIATRKDHYERMSLPPRRYLFQSLHEGSFLVPAHEAFLTAIKSFIADYNTMAHATGKPTLKPMRPHDFRRIFATDLLDKEVPIESVRHLLGHTNIATTAIYDHTTWDRAAAKFLQAHRLAVQRADLIPCPHCDGTGLVHQHTHEPAT